MRIARRLLATFSLLASVGLLCACGGGSGVAIPSGSDELEQCESTLLQVEELASRGEPGCDLVGSLIQLPDGTSLEVQEVGVVFSHQGSGTGFVTYTIVNWGVPGVTINTADDGRLIDLWASSAVAEDLTREQLRLDGIEGS